MNVTEKMMKTNDREPLLASVARETQPKALAGYVDTEALAASLGVHPTTLVKWRTARRGPPFTRLGKRVLYNLEKFRQWLEQQEQRSLR